MKLDNFALTMFQTCPAKYALRIKQGWTPRFKSGALGFGGALHEGLAAWYKTGDIEKALLAIYTSWPADMPVDDYRTREKCLHTMAEYAKNYPSETFSVVQGPSGPLIEVPFTLDTGMYLPCGLSFITDKLAAGYSHPLPCTSNKLPDDGHCPDCMSACEPIEYGGIFDGLVEYSGSVYVLEHKSTSMLGATYFNQFKPNNQVTGYVWAAGQLSGRRVGGAIINAIGIYKAGKTRFERHITGRFPVEIEEWLQNVRQVCIQIKTAELTGHWPKATGACTMYGMCEFYSVHSLGHPAERQKRLEMDYVIEHWDYEKRGGTEVPSASTT